MANIYIRNTKNEIVSTIDAESIDSTSTSLSLVGKSTEEYLKEINTNFYKLLENFASEQAPLNPQIGQLWYAKKGRSTIEVSGISSITTDGDMLIKIHNNLTNSTKTYQKKKRGVNLIIFNDTYKGTNAPLFDGYYDIYSSNIARTQLANKLSNIKDDEIFIIASYEGIGTNDTLRAAMTKLNSQAWHKVKDITNNAYAAIGSGKVGIVAEDLESAKESARVKISYESTKVESGFHKYTSLNSDMLLVWDGEIWQSSAQTLDGRTAVDVRKYILSGVDLSVKFDKTGGTIIGSLTVDGTLIPKTVILPSGNEIQDLGTPAQRFKNIHLSENSSIYMGEHKQFNKNSFVYTVESETGSVKTVPNGALILNRATGEAVIKNNNAVNSSSNVTFRGLSKDKKSGTVIGGHTYNFNGDRGVFMGSWNESTIQYISIPVESAGIQTFGSMRRGGHSAGASDGTRGLSFWQHSTGGIQYITIATPMNAINFGAFKGGWGSAAVSDGSKALVIGGAYTQSTSQYTVFATPMNASNFGDLGTNAYWIGACSDGTRGVFDSGKGSKDNNFYKYITISTMSNAVYFGNMTTTRGYNAAASDGVSGLWVGGHRTAPMNNIEKITIQSPGNGISFGTLSYSRHTANAVANSNKLVASSGSDSSSKMLDQVSFANGGTSVKFAESSKYTRYSAAFSGN